jgi:hypothetical protein
MAQNRRFGTELRQLRDLAVFCYRLAEPLLDILPRDREAQKKIVDVLTAALQHTDFTISKDLLIEEVALSDSALLDAWVSSSRQMAWLMVHPQMSDYFARFAMHWWKPEVFLVHHIPKTAGTSTYELLEKQGYFVFYPQRSFEEMVELRGLMGFARQLMRFEGKFKQDRIYVGGHFVLPDVIRDLSLFGLCQGVTLCRPPMEVLSSAIRYVWTKAEGGDVRMAARYGLEGIAEGELKLSREGLGKETTASHRIADILTAITQSAAFHSDFDEVYAKYFYNQDIRDPDRLFTYLVECGEIFPSLDPKSDAKRTLAALKIVGELPRSNISILSDSDLVRAMGGRRSFKAFADERMSESVKIYDVIVKLRKRLDQAGQAT